VVDKNDLVFASMVKKEFKDMTPLEKRMRIKHLWQIVRIKLIVSQRFVKTA